jgi:hypothetical protein
VLSVDMDFLLLLRSVESTDAARVGRAAQGPAKNRSNEVQTSHPR